MQIDDDLASASATPLVLTVLSEGESYGYAILKGVRELSGGELEWPDGLVYPLFHRLRRLGYLTTEWRTLPDGRCRRYYAITDDGQAVLARWQRQWASAMRALNGVWSGPGRLLTALGEACASTVPQRRSSSSRPLSRTPAPRGSADPLFRPVLGVATVVASVPGGTCGCPR